MADGGVFWCSLDPVRRKLDFYPVAMTERLEASMTAGSPECVLGADFFNATVHFHQGGPGAPHYQTTPGQQMGRGGFKQPGYRSVRRVVKSGPTVTLHGKRVHGEWRIVETEAEAEYTFVEEVPAAAVLGAGAGFSHSSRPRPWAADDLREAAASSTAPLVIWQWCRGTVERDGDLIRLPEAMWTPFLEGNNRAIEEGHASGAERASIALGPRRLAVAFTQGPESMFALQRDDEGGKERCVRRVVKTARELQAMFAAFTAPANYAHQHATEQLDALSLSEGSGNADALPQAFMCPILQELLRDPVLTVDGHTYERSAIEQWLGEHNTSPLTGLPLASTELAPNAQLLTQIASFLAAHPHLRPT